MNWERIAHYCEETYGAFVDWDEEFFICVECNESIYKTDWNDSDFALGRSYRGRLRLYCPVCEEKLIDEGEEFN